MGDSHDALFEQALQIFLAGPLDPTQLAFVIRLASGETETGVLAPAELRARLDAICFGVGTVVDTVEAPGAVVCDCIGGPITTEARQLYAHKLPAALRPS